MQCLRDCRNNVALTCPGWGIDKARLYAAGYPIYCGIVGILLVVSENFSLTSNTMLALHGTAQGQHLARTA
jgi:hypothetical protein